MINPFLQSLSRRNKFLAACCSSFFRSSKFSALSRREAPSKSSQGFTLCFNFSFFSFDHPFVTGVLHGGSTRWFIKDLYSFSKFSSRFFSKKLKHSSSCYPECNFFLPYLWRWYYVLLDNSPSLLRESQVIKNEIF